MNLWNFIIGHPYLLALTLVAVGMLLYEELLALLSRGWLVSVGEAIALVNHDNAEILDLRDEKSFDNGHILGARRVTKEQLSGQVKNNRPLVLVLTDDLEFWQVKKRLPQSTVAQLKVLQGGVVAWQDAGLPLVK